MSAPDSSHITVPRNRQAITTAATSANPRCARLNVTGDTFPPIQCIWLCTTHSKGSVPKANAPANSAPRIADPFTIASPSITYNGPHGSSGVANPSNPARHPGFI